MLATHRWKMGFIKDFCWVTDVFRRDIWTFGSVKKHDGQGVSLYDLFLTSCCVKAPWLCNLPCGLKQCRLDFFSPLYLCFHPLLSWCLFFPESSSDLVFSGSSVASIRSHGPKLASPAISCLAGADGVCLWPLPHLGGQGGTRRDEEAGRGAQLRATGRCGRGRQGTQLEIHGA